MHAHRAGTTEPGERKKKVEKRQNAGINYSQETAGK